jgi:hypothetical protein
MTPEEGRRVFAAGRVEVSQVPEVRARDGENAGRLDASPVEDVERAADLRGHIHVVRERQLQRAVELDRNVRFKGNYRVPGVRLENEAENPAPRNIQTIKDRDRDRSLPIIILPVIIAHLKDFAA